MIGGGSGKRGGRVAICASKQAGVVDPDVPALNTATRRPLRPVFLVADINPEEALNELIVDAFAPFHTIRHQVYLLSAAHNFHAVARTNLRQARN